MHRAVWSPACGADGEVSSARWQAQPGLRRQGLPKILAVKTTCMSSMDSSTQQIQAGCLSTVQ